MAQDKTTIWESWAKLWNGDLAIADRLIAPEFFVHFAPMFPGQGEVRGADGLKQMIQMLGGTFKDYQFVTEVGPLVDSDMLAGRWEFQGVFGGGIPGAEASVGKQVRYHGIDIFRVADGKIVEYWLCSDTLSLLQQIGVIPA